ncbi:hypothetical protein [uncultured Microbacterium sp.]|uniref:hypothetical protein n=1 Tax=uncultured Microbacterium sp. TaxID=191216 RepID=UPI0028E8EA99|nr:hypothetical protein [uncultured Microbacterium sp.]
MRKPRRTNDGPTFDPIQEELDKLVALMERSVLALPGMTQAKLDAQNARSAAKWDRRKAKALAKWDRMTVLERKAWADAYYLEARRQRPNAKPAPTSELPLLFAIITIAERDNAKAAKRPVVDRYALHSAAAGMGDDQPRATRPSPAPEAPPADTEPSNREKPRKRRRGPAVGPIGYQIDGVLYPTIYDEDD